MKNFRRVLIAAVFAVILALGAVCLTACGDKDNGGGKTKPRYTLTFMAGTVLYDTVTEEEGSSYKLNKEDPTRPNYVFEGWSQTPNGEVEALPDKIPAGNRTYYAIFSARYNLNFNAGIGSIPDDKKTITVKEGDELYPLVSALTPTVSDGDATFKGWFLRGTSEITATSGQKMPNANAEVVAKYSVKYTINIYLEDGFESGDYAAEPDDVVREIAYVGDKVTGLPSYSGYYYDESKDNDVLYSNLNKNSAQNAFDLYYKLIGYDTIFNANLPSDVEYTGTMESKTCGHGIEYDAPECDFAADGYRFYGWSTTPDGEVEYREGEKFSVERATTLYAQWVKGMTEIAGLSSDRVYLISKKVGNGERLVPYLERTGLADIVGEYDATTHIFTFKNANAANPDAVMLRGVADKAHNTFTYLNTVEATAYKLQKIDGTEDANVTLTLNDNGTAVYNDGTDTFNGAYIASNDGSMLFTVDGEALFAFRLVRSSAALVSFMIRGEEYGTWNNISQAGIVDTAYTLELDGYGYATMHVYGINSSITAMVTNDFGGRYWYTDGEGAYSGDEGTEVTVVIYNSSLQARMFDCLLMTGSYHSLSSDDTTVYTNVYLQKFEATLYGAPTGDAELDTATADKIELSGYSVVADSATYTYKDGDNATVTVKGKYSYDRTAGTLRITPNTGRAFLFEVSVIGSGENAVPVFEPVDELFGQYRVIGLDSQNFGASTIYTLHIFNNNRAAIAFRMPMYEDTFYGNIAFDYTRMIYGEYSVVTEGKTEDGGYDPRGNVYEFTAEISPQVVYYLYNLYYNLYQTPLNVSGFGSFRFQFVYSAATGNISYINVTTRGDFQGGNKLTYNGVEYTLDGFGTAESASGDKLKYSYGTVGGIPMLDLTPDEYKPKETVMFIDWERNGSFAEHAGNYGALNSDTYFRMIVFKDDSAVLTLGTSSTSLDPFSFGHVTWDDETRKSGKYMRDADIEFSDIYIGVNKMIYSFKFKIGIVKNSYNQEVEVIIIYDVNANVNEDNQIVIDTEDGKLTLSPAAVDDNGVATAAAVYVEKGKNGRNDTEYKGTFRYVSDDVVQLVYSVQTTSGTSSAIITFRLEYDEEKEIVGFHKLIDGAGGYFMDADDGKSYLYLSSEKNEDNKYVGVYYEYDEENETFIEHEGVYGFTSTQDALYDQNYGIGQDFTYETGETDDDGNVVTETITFAMATTQAGVPYFLRYTPRYNNIYVLYMSASIGRPAAVGTLSGGGYSALVLTLYPGTVYQTQYQGVIEWSDEYLVNVFTATDGSTFYLRYIQGMGLFLLDNTYVAETKGIFELSEPIDVEVPAIPAHTAHATKIEMSGMAFAYLHYDYEGEERTVTGIYVQYATNGFAFITVGDEDTTELFRFRLNMVTDEITGEVTYVAELADMNYYGTFEGEDLTVINLNGFTSAYYVDSYGRVFGGMFEVLESDETSALIRIMYIDTVEYTVNYTYARLDFENRTFVAAAAPETDQQA